MGENSYDISVVVVTYNPRWDAERDTLDSILKQKGVTFEIIIADDGSKDSCFSLVKEYFAERNFTDYKLVANPVNKGTVCNGYSGISVAKGKYVKGISPGDMLYKEDTLRNWIDFMESRGLKWSFSDVIYYQKVNGKITPVKVRTHPNRISVYEHGTDEECRWQYCALGDIAVGASMIGLRTLRLEYYKQILGKVVYAEDNTWRMMMFDGIVGGFYNQHTILYEYGTGISTSNSSVWAERIQKDSRVTDEILSARKNLDDFQIEMQEAYRILQGKSKFKKIFVKGKLKTRAIQRKSIGYLP